MKRTLLFFILWTAIAATADDGSRLWLRYSITPSPTTSVQFEQGPDPLVNQSDRAIIDNALDELVQHWLGLPLLLRLTGGQVLPKDAFHIAKVNEESFLITSSSATGLLYAAYFVLRSQTMGDGCLCQTLGPDHELTDRPETSVRSVSISNPEVLEGRITTFARAMASVGINDVVIPSSSFMKVAEMQDSLKVYGIVVHCGEIVANVLPLTDDTNWTGEHLLQYKCYDIARSQWRTDLSPERIVCEWLAQTFSDNPYFVISMRDAMLSSGTERPKRLIDTWQEMQQYIDRERFGDVEQCLMNHLLDEK